MQNIHKIRTMITEGHHEDINILLIHESIEVLFLSTFEHFIATRPPARPLNDSF